MTEIQREAKNEEVRRRLRVILILWNEDIRRCASVDNPEKGKKAKLK